MFLQTALLQPVMFLLAQMVLSHLSGDHYYESKAIERGPTEDSEIMTISSIASIQFGAVLLHIQLSFLPNGSRPEHLITVLSISQHRYVMMESQSFPR